MPASNPKISVLMAAYNNAATVSAAIESILKQTYSDFELIIIDDASTDATLTAINSLATRDARIVVLKNEKNEGLAVALNKGLEIAKGEFVARQDAHGTSHPERFAKQVKYLTDNADIGVLATAAVSYIPPAVADADIKLYLRSRNIIVHGSVMMRATILKAAGGYNPNYRYVQDYELWLRLAKTGVKFSILPEPLYALDTSKKSLAVTKTKLLYLMNLKSGNQQIKPLSQLPFIRKLQFFRYLLRYFVKRNSGI